MEIGLFRHLRGPVFEGAERLPSTEKFQNAPDEYMCKYSKGVENSRELDNSIITYRMGADLPQNTIY